MKTVFAGRPRVAISGTAENSDSTPYPIENRVKTALAADLRESQLSRAEVAMRISGHAGRVITAAMIEAWVAETKNNRFPVELLPAWTAVTGSRRLIEMLCGDIGLSLCMPEDLEFAKLGRVQLSADKLREKLWEKI
jgi:hypothetical protein